MTDTLCGANEVEADGERCVFRLRGLPFTAQADDVRAFCQPFKVLEVLMCERSGRPTGEAYVVLPPSADPDMCLNQLNNKYIGSRYIELFESTEADLRAVKSLMADRLFTGHVVRLRGLPYSAGEADVRGFLAGARLADGPDAVVMAQAPDGRPTGEAYVELKDEQALALALTRHKEVLGGRYIEVFSSSRLKMFSAFQQAQTNSRPRNRNRLKPQQQLRPGKSQGGLHAPQAPQLVLQQQQPCQWQHTLLQHPQAVWQQQQDQLAPMPVAVQGAVVVTAAMGATHGVPALLPLSQSGEPLLAQQPPPGSECYHSVLQQLSGPMQQQPQLVCVQTQACPTSISLPAAMAANSSSCSSSSSSSNVTTAGSGAYHQPVHAAGGQPLLMGPQTDATAVYTLVGPGQPVQMPSWQAVAPVVSGAVPHIVHVSAAAATLPHAQQQVLVPAGPVAVGPGWQQGYPQHAGWQSHSHVVFHP